MSQADGRVPDAAQQRLDVPEPPVRPRQCLPRAADLAVAAVALVLVSPLLLAVGIAIRLESPGPVFYRQRRVGRTVGSSSSTSSAPCVRGRSGRRRHGGDGRRPAGDAGRRFLRRYSLDELPNLINVLRGEMRIVGPRATLPAQVELYTPRQLRRLDLRPGVTGWAQIHGRTGIPWEERIELDVWYVEHRSLWLDLRILAKTPAALLGGAGSLAADPYAGSSKDSPLRQAAERERARGR
jgi:lipopolysaccharide/colanic/teichoic acid biosynthesis glycosyltransferase